MTRRALAIAAALTMGCAFNLGKTTGDKTVGVSIALGQTSVGPVEGGAISLPGVSALGGILCAATTAGMLFLGRSAPACATVGQVVDVPPRVAVPVPVPPIGDGPASLEL